MSTGEHLGREAARRLATRGSVEITAPLNDDEIARIETILGFEFADDHRAFLSTGLPRGDRWPDWRAADLTALPSLLAWPRTGVLFDVQHNGFWDQRWGVRPADQRAALALAQERLADAPQMVPVYGHRYLPAGRGTHGHPVMSMYQTDIICYGTNLADYISREFGDTRPIANANRQGRPHTTVVFWSDLIT